MRTHDYRWIVFIALAGSTFPAALAQNNTDTAPAASTPTPSETITLSPFEVQAGNDGSYVASESMTGSRIATQIKDLPFTVNVLTSEYFDDFGMFELADNVVQIGGFTGLDIGGGFNLRGFSSTSQLRDGFLRLGRYGASNVDRLEVIKGPNASGLYGRSSPGGMINMISKQPRRSNYQKLTLSYGSFDYARGILEANGTLGADRATQYIVTLSQFEKGFDTEYARNRNKEGYFAIAHDFKDRSRLFFSAEYFLQVRHSPNSSAPLVIDQRGTSSTLDDVAVGYAKPLTEYNAFGPFSELNRGNIGANVTYAKTLNDVWSFRGAGNYYRARRWDYNQNTGFGTININTTSGIISTTRGATPTKGHIFEDGGGFQGDVLAHYFLADGKIESRTLLTIDFNDYYRYDPTRSYGPASNPDIAAWNAVRTIRLNPDLTPQAPIQYFRSPWQWGNEITTRLTRRRTTVLGGLFRQQTIFMDGRLLTYTGARFDSARFRQRDYLVNIPGIPLGGLVDKTVDEFKPNLGANFKATPNLRIYANYSESYFIDQTTNPADIASPLYESEVAQGYDYGIKGSYLNDQLNFTVGGYYITRENVSVMDTVESPIGSGNYVNISRRDGDQLVRGFEVDVNWRVNEEVSAGLSYGYVNSRYTDFGSASPLSIGRRVANISPHNGGAYIKYSPTSGALKGFSANLGVTYVSATPSEQPNAGDNYTTVNGTRVLVSSTRQWALEVPSFTLWNVGVRYRMKSHGNLEHTFALNVNNVFDKDYLKVNKQAGERRGFFFTYTLTRSGS